jgi:hypothetical protein
MNYAHQ